MTYDHGHNRKRQRSPTYRSWGMMVTRCTNPNVENYKYYGGRGIKVCDGWRDFSTFLSDMGSRPSLEHSLDRWPNKDGDYEPGNCRWATQTDQCRNRRANHLVKVAGQEMSLREAVERFGAASYKCTHLRITRLGWSVNDALTTPSERKGASHVEL